MNEANIPEFVADLRSYDHWKADTLIILNCHSIAQQDQFFGCIAFSPDNNAFVLIHHYPNLPQSVLF